MVAWLRAVLLHVTELCLSLLSLIALSLVPSQPCTHTWAAVDAAERHPPWSASPADEFLTQTWWIEADHLLHEDACSCADNRRDLLGSSPAST